MDDAHHILYPRISATFPDANPKWPRLLNDTQMMTLHQPDLNQYLRGDARIGCRWGSEYSLTKPCSTPYSQVPLFLLLRDAPVRHFVPWSANVVGGDLDRMDGTERNRGSKEGEREKGGAQRGRDSLFISPTWRPRLLVQMDLTQRQPLDIFCFNLHGK